jgi:phosphatidylglycerol:prolipoprotein diacylglycerol transferase
MERRSPGRKGLRSGDILWALALLAVIAFLLLRDFAWGGGVPLQFALGPLKLSIFGLLAALDMLFGIYLIHRWCERFDLDWETLSRGLPWIILLGYYISHLVSVAFYFPDDLTNPLALLDARTRISSFGGMYGGGLVAVIFLRRHGLPLLRYADALTYGFVGGYVFGRAGCFAIHDHPGIETSFPLAVEIGGRMRHDLGFYEMLLMLALLIAATLIARQGKPADGTIFAFVAILYAPTRFFFDSLRVADPTYAGLTPGQWLALPMLVLGLWAAWWAHASRAGRTSSGG